MAEIFTLSPSLPLSLSLSLSSLSEGRGLGADFPHAARFFSACGADSSASASRMLLNVLHHSAPLSNQPAWTRKRCLKLCHQSACRCRGFVRLLLGLHRYASDSMNSGFVCFFWGGGMADFLRRFLVWADNVGAPPRGPHISVLVEGSETCICTCAKMPKSWALCMRV